MLLLSICFVALVQAQILVQNDNYRQGRDQTRKEEEEEEEEEEDARGLPPTH